MLKSRSLLVAAVAFACLALATAQETIESHQNCMDGAGEVVVWHIAGSNANPAILLLSSTGTIRGTDGAYDSVLVGEALRLMRMGYTVAAMNVFSAEKANMASLDMTTAAQDYAVNIKGGIDYVMSSVNTPWIDASKSISLMGWGFGANGVLAAISHSAVGPMLKAAVAYTPDIADGKRASLNVTHEKPELFVAVGYDMIANLEAFEADMNAGSNPIKWEISVMSDTMMHFNVVGNTNFLEDQTRRVTLATWDFLSNVIMGTTRGSTPPATAPVPPAQPASPLKAEYFNYAITADSTSPGVAIWDETMATNTSKKPAVIVIPAWNGYAPYEIQRQMQLASEGYVTMSANIYGLPVGQKVDNGTLQGQYAGMYRGGTENPPTAENVEKGQLFTDRIMSAKAAVAALPNVDATKIAVLGFCFGGTGVYNVFRYDEGDEIQVGISMHGSMRTTANLDGVTGLPGGYLLMVSGGADGGESGADLVTHLADLTTAAADLDWEVMRFSAVLHGFSEWESGRYNADAEGRGTRAMLDVLANEWGMPTTSAGCTALDACTCPDAAATGCTATVISNAMCSPTPVPETDPTETVEPEWTCQKGATASECFGAVIGAYETAQMARRDAREMVWTCDDATAVQADVADCFAVNECCGADWAAWTDFWLDTQFDGCDFGTCVEAANKVAFTARLSVTKAAFDANTNDVMTKYKSAVATAAGNDVSVADVIITGTTDQSTRRRLLADAVDIDTEVRTGSASAATAVIAAMTQDNLNTALVGVGLDAGSITGAPAVKEIPTTDSAGHAVPSMMMALGAVFASLAFLF